MNRSQRERLKEKIEKLDAHEHAQIFDLVKTYTDNYTKTQNGVLISSDSLPDECLLKIEKMVTYYIDQKVRMDAETVERKAMSSRT